MACVGNRGSKFIRVEASIYDVERQQKLATGRGLFFVKKGDVNVAESVTNLMMRHTGSP